MRGTLALGLACLALALAIPLLLAPPSAQEPGASASPYAHYAGADEDISFTALSGGEAVETTMAEWLPGVVAGEMPASLRTRRSRPRPWRRGHIYSAS